MVVLNKQLVLGTKHLFTQWTHPDLSFTVGVLSHFSKWRRSDEINKNYFFQCASRTPGVQNLHLTKISV